ncbi:hypothetical protein [Pyrococcus yayanosii]|uniref:Uncharacterized protein n=1 Tax=Pyrococcus yayanosii (strain CH1 / JCM 16557) TaxID=529709 RepID=F8AER9_PYRYC|nr:hypothetical protein [Pyrococcus yayanosii]AEH24751.1 hypothetical protein PYCH_10700 [Pyrococcus yayanosii CH1]
MKRGFLLNVTALLLLIPILLLVATYESVSSTIISGQITRTQAETMYFNVDTIQKDLQNVVDLSIKRAYLTLTEYVITHNVFVNNASRILEELIINGTINGRVQPTMKNMTLKKWFNNVITYLRDKGMSIEPSTPDELESHLDILVGPLDSFHIAVRVKIKNITIRDNSGIVKYQGDIGYVYSVVSVVGFEDPFIVKELNGLYTRVIMPCRIPFPGPLYGYYNPNSTDDIDELALEQCYVGLSDNKTAGVYYPSILERFEGDIGNHDYYLSVAVILQKDLGYTEQLPIGLVTFMVPSTDSTLIGAFTSLGISAPLNSTSVDYYYLKCAVEGEECLGGYPLLNSPYPDLRFDNATAIALFNTTEALDTG